jgi:hypothetical protein
MLLIPFTCYAMTHDEFFNTYDYEYKYMIKYSNGHTNYISCEYPVTFSMSIYNQEGETMKSGNSLCMSYEGTIYQLRNNGSVGAFSNNTLYAMEDPVNLIGFSYADVYRRSGSSFFLPITLKHSPFRQILAGLIPILGLIVLVLSLRKAWVFLRVQLTM